MSALFLGWNSLFSFRPRSSRCISPRSQPTPSSYWTISLLLCKINIRSSQLQQSNYWKYSSKKEYNACHLCLDLSFLWASFSSLLLSSSQNQMLRRNFRNSQVGKWSYVGAPQSARFKQLSSVCYSSNLTGSKALQV